MTDVDRSTAQEISELLRTMPSCGSPPQVRADWLDRKAAVLERVAAEDPDLSAESAELAALAGAAARRARRDAR